MVESEEEHSHGEESIFDVVSEEENTDDERGFESEDEDIDDDDDSDSDMDSSTEDDNLESAEEDGEATYVPGGLFWISLRPFADRNSPAEYFGESILEVEWPSSAWRNAFNQTEQN